MGKEKTILRDWLQHFYTRFEDRLVGCQLTKKEINVTFPEDYHSEELAGKPAIFKVKVKGIKVKAFSLDDDLLKM